MATTKNITMKQFNGTDYDTLYPKTVAAQIVGAVPIASGGTNGTTASSGVNNLVAGLSQITPASNDLFPFRDISGNTGGSVTLANLVNALGNNGVITNDNLNLDTKVAALGYAKIATGSYVGTGTFGVDNPCSLTFPFSPKILIFFERHELRFNSGPFDMLTPSLSSIGNYGVPRIWLANTNHQITGSVRSDYGDDGVYVQVSWGVTTQWYAIGQGKEPTAGTQLNISGQTYDYCAIG